MRSFNHRTDKRARASDVFNTDVESQRPEEKKIRGRNKMHRPRHGQIVIIPEGDSQFRYANYSLNDTMKKGPILGVILKQEYPPIIKDTDGAGQEVKYHASKWEHYSHIKRDDTQTAADRVREEFWSIYSVPEEHEHEAEIVFENYAHIQCKNMLYQARITAVKKYYRDIIKSPKSDAFACAKLLTLQQYMKCMPDWFTEEAWESLCKYWCSNEYLELRGRGQESRKKNPEGAQNRGGSRPLVETQQYLEAKYGPGKATIINTYCCMKSGVKNCDGNGNAGPIPERAQQLVDDYNAALQEKYPDNWQEQPFDGEIAYDVGGGLPHGRLAIGHGAIKKAPIIGAAKGNIRPSTSRAFQNLFRRYEEEIAKNRQLTEQTAILVQQNADLTQHAKRTDRVLQLIAQKVQIEIPPDLAEEEENQMVGARDGSSHASANLENNMENNSDGH